MQSKETLFANLDQATTLSSKQTLIVQHCGMYTHFLSYCKYKHELLIFSPQVIAVLKLFQVKTECSEAQGVMKVLFGREHKNSKKGKMRKSLSHGYFMNKYLKT